MVYLLFFCCCYVTAKKTETKWKKHNNKRCKPKQFSGNEARRGTVNLESDLFDSSMEFSNKIKTVKNEIMVRTIHAV